MSELPTYYEQFGPFERRWKKILNRIRLPYKKNPVFLIEINWRLGDEIMAIPFYEALYKDLESSDNPPQIHVWCTYPDLLIDNPYIQSVNKKTVVPDGYVLLRGVSRFVPRSSFYRDEFSIRSDFGTPKLYYSDWAYADKQELGISSAKMVALCPGASWDTKRWSDEKWKNLAEDLKKNGYQVIELGNEGEAIGAGLDYTGKTSVREAALLLHRADIVVTHDSGLMHLSLAVGSSTLALFGPTNSEILIQENPLLTIITNERDCQGCWNKPKEMIEPGVCPLQITSCMDTIPVENVVDMVREVSNKELH